MALRTFAGKIVGRLLGNRGPRPPRDYLAIVNYHQVAPVFDPQQHWPGNWTSLDHFRRTLEQVRRTHRIVRLSEAVAALEEGRLEGPCLALSFDDGDISVQEHVVPLLTELGLPATFFVCTAYQAPGSGWWARVYLYLKNSGDPALEAKIPEEIRRNGPYVLRCTRDRRAWERLRRQLEDAADLLPRRPYFVGLDWLDGLDDRLFEVGLHGHEHNRFSMLTDEQQEENLRRNIEALSPLRAYQPLFAFPYGRGADWDLRLVRRCLAMDLRVFAAEGGINLHQEVIYSRIPADSLNVPAILRREWKRSV